MSKTYGKIYRYDTADAPDLTGQKVTIEEKIDGSQFSFGMDSSGNLFARSKNRDLDLDQPDALFASAIAGAKGLHQLGLLRRNAVYFAEAMRGPRHNKLRYERSPMHGFVLFDVFVADKTFPHYLNRAELNSEVARLDHVELVQSLGAGPFSSDLLDQVLQSKPMLGGDAIEGVVVKHHTNRAHRFKYVNPSFSEVKVVKRLVRVDGIAELADSVSTPERWDKVVTHLHEDGRLTGTKKDIGTILSALVSDIEEEEGWYIKEQLYALHQKELRNNYIKKLRDKLLDGRYNK